MNDTLSTTPTVYAQFFRYMHRPDSDLDLLQQFTIYEAVLSYEDGDDECRTRTIDPTIRLVSMYTFVKMYKIKKLNTNRYT